MTIQRHETGTRMSQAVVHGNTAYFAGQVGNAGESVAAQTATVLEKIENLLAMVGSDKSKLLQATIWLADIGDFAAMNEVWDAWVEPGHAPARAYGESKLARPDLLVEIIAVAAVD